MSLENSKNAGIWFAAPEGARRPGRISISGRSGFAAALILSTSAAQEPFAHLYETGGMRRVRLRG